MQNFWQKKKGHIFFISKIFHIRSTLYLVKPSLWTSASQYFDSVCFRQCRRRLNTYSFLTLIIKSNKKCISRWFNSGVFQPCSGVFSRCERRYPNVKGCNSGASQKISREQVVTCLAHSKEHFKPILAEYWGGGCTVYQVTSRTKRELELHLDLSNSQYLLYYKQK